MLVPITRVLRRLRQPRSRAEELRAVRRRFERSGRAGVEERAVAVRMRALRQELAATFGDARSCATCAVGRPMPIGRFDGGHCCSGATDDVLSDAEVAALATGGTRPRDLRPPDSDHAGCAFRGERGCTLDAANRPNVCVRFVCRGFSHELFERDVLDRVEALSDELDTLFARFTALRGARLLDEEWAALGAAARWRG